MPKSGDCQIEINTDDGFTIDIDKIDHGSMTINRDTFRKTIESILQSKQNQISIDLIN